MPKFLGKLIDKITHKNEIKQLADRAELADIHIIALCRLTMIKPSTLYREVNNTKANLDYLRQLLEAKSHAETDISAKT